MLDLTLLSFQMYALFHPDFTPEKWHVLMAYIACSWTCCLFVMFGNRVLPKINDLGLFFIVAGVVISVAVCTILPTTRKTGYASNHFVWSDWQNGTGYSNNGFVFVMGMLNGAFALGVPGWYPSTRCDSENADLSRLCFARSRRSDQVGQVKRSADTS